ncbi:MAG: hypothetical protein ABIH25_03610 [Candidatus Woesearchaeota archaeon]
MGESLLMRLEINRNTIHHVGFNRFIASILLQAVRDLAKYSEDDSEYHDSKVWIDREDYQDYLFSLESVCYFLDFDPKIVRENIYKRAEDLRRNRLNGDHLEDLTFILYSK